jgi:hypothetical protein
LKPDDFHYALENTKVILSPQKRLETFGTTVLNYHLITEEMDAVNRMRVREGRIHAQKPELVTPDGFAKLLLDGFGEKAERYADAVSEFASQITILKYGFTFRKDETRRYDVTGALAEVSDRVKRDVEAKGDPLSAVLTGVDDGWEVCLLKFALDMVLASGGDHVRDLKRRGLL